MVIHSSIVSNKLTSSGVLFCDSKRGSVADQEDQVNSTDFGIPILFILLLIYV